MPDDSLDCLWGPILHGVKHVSFELGTECNLAKQHAECPILQPSRWPETRLGPITVSDILSTIDDAVELGFKGFIGFHYYNEPLLNQDTIREVIGASSYGRFVLWTNGLLLSRRVEDNEILRLFEWVVISDYFPERNAEWLAALKGHYCDVRVDSFHATFDQRLKNYDAPSHASVQCWRQRLEIPIDHFGNVHLCCQDWRGSVGLGNIKTAPLHEILSDQAYVQMVAALCAGSKKAPPICRTCTNPIDRETYLEACAGFSAD